MASIDIINSTKRKKKQKQCFDVFSLLLLFFFYCLLAGIEFYQEGEQKEIEFAC